MRDGKFEASKASLTDAAGHLARTAVKQKAVFLADIATVELAGGDLDQACAYGTYKSARTALRLGAELLG